MRLFEFDLTNPDIKIRIMTGNSLALYLQDHDRKAYDEMQYIGISNKREELHITLWENVKFVGDLEMQVNPYNIKELWIMHIAVRKGYEGKGYAKKLVNTLFKYAIENGYKSITRSSPSDEGKIKLSNMMDKFTRENPNIKVKRAGDYS